MRAEEGGRRHWSRAAELRGRENLVHGLDASSLKEEGGDDGLP